MEMADLAYYLSFVLNGLIATLAFLFMRASMKAARIDEIRAKRIFSVVTLLAGLLCGLVFFNAAVWLLRNAGLPVNTGHGEVVLAAALFNLLLSLAFVIVGRVLLGWRPLDWR